MVLQDDIFVTNGDAIAEGRGIFDNIRKSVNHLLSANAGEVLVVFIGVVLGSVLYPSLFAGQSEALIPTPTVLLWINLVTDGLPAVALGTELETADIMNREARTHLINRRVMLSIATIGVLISITGLALFFYGGQRSRDPVLDQTLLVMSLVVEMIQLIRSRYELSPFSNRWLVGAVLTSLALQLAVVYTPLNDFFDIVPVGTAGWLWIVAAFVAVVGLGFVVENATCRVVEEYQVPDEFDTFCAPSPERTRRVSALQLPTSCRSLHYTFENVR
jgi:Ca2+-transporting ATPase